jgi:ferredoxin
VSDTAATVNIVFKQGETRKEVSTKVGETFLQTAHNHDIDLEGACEGKKRNVPSLIINGGLDWTLIRLVAFTFHFIYLRSFFLGVCACSTCHLIFPENVFNSLPESSEEEEDMLDMAFGLTETSRLGCQVEITEAMDGMVVEMPKMTRNFYVDGHVPVPH